MKMLTLIFCLLAFACATDAKKERVSEDLNQVSIDIDTIEVEIRKEKSKTAIYLEEQGLVDVDSLDPSIQVDLKYATNDNFTGNVLYDDLQEAYLHPIAAEKLLKAQQILKKMHPNYSLLVYDAARPVFIQQKLYEVVQGTKYQAYVANPSRTGLHNYGMAVDLTICDEEGQPLDMGTAFDFFGKAAGINQEDELKRQGVFTQQQVDNRRLLRKIMVDAGFLTIRGEWWHFNAVSLAEAKRMVVVIK